MTDEELAEVRQQVRNWRFTPTSSAQRGKSIQVAETLLDEIDRLRAENAQLNAEARFWANR